VATTFVKVQDEAKIQELWRAGLLWRKTLCNVKGTPIPELTAVRCPDASSTFFMARWWTDYGYMVED